MKKSGLLTAIMVLSIGTSLLAGCSSQPTTKVVEKAVEVNYDSSPEQILSSYTEEGMNLFKTYYPSQVFREYALKEVGKEASDFELKNLKGDTIKLSSFKGKKVVLEFEKTTSDVSKKSSPAFDKVSKEDKDTIYLTIFPMDTKADIEKYYTDLKLEVNQTAIAGKDNGDKMNLIKSYSLTSVPTLVFVDESGKISYTSIGNFDENTLKGYENVAFGTTKLYDMVRKEQVEVDKNGKVIKTITPTTTDSDKDTAGSTDTTGVSGTSSVTGGSAITVKDKSTDTTNSTPTTPDTTEQNTTK
jgi:Peroxiredoxin